MMKQERSKQEDTHFHDNHFTVTKGYQGALREKRRSILSEIHFT